MIVTKNKHSHLLIIISLPGGRSRNKRELPSPAEWRERIRSRRRAHVVHPAARDGTVPAERLRSQ